MSSVGEEPYESASRAEAVAADVHHRHHPADGNAGVVRGRPGHGAALVATAVTLVGVVLLALAIGTG